MISYHGVAMSARFTLFKPLGLGNPLKYDETYTKTAMSDNNAPRHAGSRRVVGAIRGGDECEH